MLSCEHTCEAREGKRLAGAAWAGATAAAYAGNNVLASADPPAGELPAGTSSDQCGVVSHSARLYGWYA